MPRRRSSHPAESAQVTNSSLGKSRTSVFPAATIFAAYSSWLNIFCMEFIGKNRRLSLLGKGMNP